MSGSAPSSAEKPVPAGTVTERTVSLPGGVLVTKRGITASDVWSYPNIHGDIAALIAAGADTIVLSGTADFNGRDLCEVATRDAYPEMVAAACT